MDYLGSVVIHGQHAEHVEGVSALGELPHGGGGDGRAPALGGGVIA